MPNSRLQVVLQQSSLHSLLIVASKMLAKSGFGDVQIMDRRTVKQRSRYGGHELLCEGQYGTLPVRVAVKVVNDDVRVRMLDEMAGTVLRTGADFGLVVTPRKLTSAAAGHQDKYRAAKVAVIDGERFTALLQHLRIGCLANGAADLGFFLEVEQIARRAVRFLDQEGR